MTEDLLWEKEQEIRRTCMLMITHKCNLNCSYCYEDFKSDKQMDFDTAISAIKKEANKTRRSKLVKGLEIDLMGGEPMLNFTLIKRLVEWAEDGNIGVPYIFSMTTNGTLFGKEEKKWFKRHKSSIVCGCSFDGNSYMQEKNRGKESNKIDLDFFSKTWKNQPFHMTISKESLQGMAQAIISALQEGYLIEVSLAEGVAWDKKDAEIYKKELEELSEYYLKNPKVKPLNILLRYLTVVNPKKDRRKIQKFCGTGTYMATYDVDGKIYGCHMFSPIVLGDRALETKDVKFRCSETVDDETCNLCILKHFCPTCAGFNYRYRNALGIRDKRKCAMHLQEAIISANFQLKLIAQRKNKLNSEDAMYAKQALKTLEIIELVKDRNKYPYHIESEVRE